MARCPLNALPSFSLALSLYEAPFGYSIEDVCTDGGIEKFRSAVYSSCARKPSLYI
ncbi:hypothetical protein AMTRI_Chr11g99520 [Amborella trichopoda]